MFWIRFYSLLDWEPEEPKQQEHRKELLKRFVPSEGKCFFINPAETATQIGAKLKSEAERAILETSEKTTQLFVDMAKAHEKEISELTEETEEEGTHYEEFGED